MGNRAVISFSKNPNETGVYLHWNGGPESVLAFCDAAKAIGSRSPESDDLYAMAGLVRAVTLFMHHRKGEILSVGVGPVSSLDTDNFDNGQYIIAGDWSIQERLHTSCKKMAVDDLNESEREQYQGMYDAIVERHTLICEHDKAEAA